MALVGSLASDHITTAGLFLSLATSSANAAKCCFKVLLEKFSTLCVLIYHIKVGVAAVQCLPLRWVWQWYLSIGADPRKSTGQKEIRDKRGLLKTLPHKTGTVVPMPLLKVGVAVVHCAPLRIEGGCGRGALPSLTY